MCIAVYFTQALQKSLDILTKIEMAFDTTDKF